MRAVSLSWRASRPCENAPVCIMHDLTESSPVYSGILFLRVLLDKRPHLILEVIECSEKLMSGGEKRWFQIRHDITQAKRFSVLLETVHLRHLVSQVSA